MDIFGQMYHATIFSSQSERTIQQDLLEILGTDNIAVLSERLIPDLRQWIPSGFSAEKLNATETLLRMRDSVTAWTRFVSSRLSGEVLIFELDDLQWADDNSMAVIRSLLNCKSSGVFYFFAAREKEVAPHSEVQKFIQGANRSGLHAIHLEALSPLHVESIIDDMTGSSSQELTDLAQIITEKTQGNPFFVTQVWWFAILHRSRMFTHDSLMISLLPKSTMRTFSPLTLTVNDGYQSWQRFMHWRKPTTSSLFCCKKPRNFLRPHKTC